MKCTNKQQDFCDYEKRGCEGCFYNKSEEQMKYNIYIVTEDSKKLMRRNVDGETVRKFVSSIPSDERKYIELERIKEERDRDDD